MVLRQVRVGSELEPGLRVESFLDSKQGISRYFGRRQGFEVPVMLYCMAEKSGDEHRWFYRVHQILSQLRGGSYGYGRCDGVLYCWEEFPRGEFLMEWSTRGERFALDVALKLVGDMLRELVRCGSRGIRHCRISPETVLLRRVSEHRVELRLMGIGVAQSLGSVERCCLDWGDYSFDLEGMSEVAVDIYGVGIILILLVSGEEGLSYFEESGELTSEFRGGLLEQSLQRALSLRLDAYQSLLEFSQDLEAAYLQFRQEEVFVSDLVGFNMAVDSVLSSSSSVERSSGEWSGIYESLGQSQRSSLLSSLTSLKAISSASKVYEEEEDDEVTKIGPLPAAVLRLQRMRGVKEDTQRVSSSEILGGSDGDFDSCPTRIMSRPNYLAVSSSPGESGVISAIQAVIGERVESSSIEQRIEALEVSYCEYQLGHAYFYPEEVLDSKRKIPKILSQDENKASSVKVNQEVDNQESLGQSEGKSNKEMSLHYDETRKFQRDDLKWIKPEGKASRYHFLKGEGLKKRDYKLWLVLALVGLLIISIIVLLMILIRQMQ